MFSKVNKTKKSFIGAITMSLVLLMGSALGVLLETDLGQITKPSSNSWADYTSAPIGFGTSGAPYQVKTAEELAWFLNNGTDAYVVLENDIDLAEHSWSGIHNTNVKSLDGKNHTIFNLNGGSGLFYTLTDSVTNIIFCNVDLFNRFNRAALGTVANVVMKSGCEVNNIYVKSGCISGYVQSGNGIGGIIGGAAASFAATISNCINNATIKNFYVAASSGNGGFQGGIVGFPNNGKIENCINTGDVIGDGYYTGGISGYAGVVTNCYAECNITGPSFVGGIIGYGGTILNSGFNGNIYVNQGTSKVGSIIGEGTASVTNSFGVANIYVSDASRVNEYGAPSTATIKSSYNYLRIITSTERTEKRKLKVGTDETEPFSEFAYNKNINGGYPFPKSLFAVGQFMECDVLSYLTDYSFEGPMELKNDGSHYYFELGEFPQTYANLTVTGGGSFSGALTGKNYVINGKTYEERLWNGQKYATYTSSLNKYDSSYTFEDGTNPNYAVWEFKVEPIKWIVLNYTDYLSGKNILAVFDRALTANVLWYTSENIAYNFANSYIRTWLNDSFYNTAFSDEDKLSLVQNDGNNINLMTKAQVETYMPQTADRACQVTDFAIANYAKMDSNRNADWWTATSNGAVLVYRVNASGDIGMGSDVAYNYAYVSTRPMIEVQA